MKKNRKGVIGSSTILSIPTTSKQKRDSSLRKKKEYNKLKKIRKICGLENAIVFKCTNCDNKVNLNKDNILNIIQCSKCYIGFLKPNK